MDENLRAANLSINGHKAKDFFQKEQNKEIS